MESNPAAAAAPLRAALFDLDGTLVRTFIDFDRMRHDLHALSERHGIGVLTRNMDDILEIVALMHAVLGDAPRDEAYACLEALERKGCAAAEPVEGAADLVRELRERRGVRVAVITRNCRPVALDLVRRLGLTHDLLLAREDSEPYFKPHPEPVFHACRALGVRPDETAMIGDLWTDIAAGRAAGVGFTVGIQWPHDPPDRFARSRPDIEVASLKAAGDLLLARAAGRDGP